MLFTIISVLAVIAASTDKAFWIWIKSVPGFFITGVEIKEEADK